MFTVAMFFAGLVALVVGANALVHGASKLALSFSISPLVVGLTVVAFGTSAPEMAVSTGAVLSGQNDVAVGNVVGSNIFNILFILGISAVILPLSVHIQVIRQEIPIMLGGAVLLMLIGIDGRIDWYEGGLLLVLLVLYTVFLVVQSRSEANSQEAEEFGEEIKPAAKGTWDSHWSAQTGLIVVGLGLLVVGADWLVDAAVIFARAMGVSDLVIGLTIVAAGTSLPEVAASVTAALKGERDIAVGNVVGSCTFNVFGCLGLGAVVSGAAGLTLAPSLLNFDLWVMLAVFLACLPVFLSGREIARWEGGVFLVYYLAYVAYLILASKDHDSLPAFSSMMLSFVLPITVVTLVVAMLGKSKAA